MPADEPDVCTSCSKQFEEIKSVVKCSLCAKCFHNVCVGIDLRGFHMKRATWTCPDCSKLMELDTKSRKRHKIDSHDMVEVDKHILENLVDMVKTLCITVGGLKTQLEIVQQENKQLHDAVIGVLGDKPQPRSQSNQLSTYAQKVKANRVKSNMQKSNRVSGAAQDKPFAFGLGTGNGNMSVFPVVTSTDKLNQPITVDLVNQAVKGAISNLPPSVNADGNFRGVTPRRRRFSKPLVIGAREPMVELGDDTTGKKSGQILEGSERRQWVYLGRVKAGMKADTVIDYVKSNWDTNDVLCIPLFSNEDICSFKIGVRESFLSSLLDASKWPRGVAIREFVHFPRSGPKVVTEVNKPVSIKGSSVVPSVQVAEESSTPMETNFQVPSTEVIAK